jgi:hypothetical protein
MRAPTESKPRKKKPPLRLSDAEVAEIDERIARRHQQKQWEIEHEIRMDEEQRQRLLHNDHTEGPWPDRLEPGTVSGVGDYVYTREEDAPLSKRRGFLEVARRDGMIRYVQKALLEPPGIDLDDYWRKRDPSWQFVMERLKGVPSNDWDRAIQQAIKDLFKTNIPPGPYTKAYLEAFYVDPDSRRRKRDQERALASVIAAEVDWLTKLLTEPKKFADAKTRAQAYLAPRWRKIVLDDRGRGLFSSGRALDQWLRDVLKR